MEDQRSSYYPPRPPIHQLSIRKAFGGLSQREKLYAHHMSRAAWHGTKIILRQVSPESIPIFDFIMELYASCCGNWKSLVGEDGITSHDCAAFLRYAATFLSNIGNYYGSGDQKFVPDLSSLEPLKRLASRSPRLQELYVGFANDILSTPPFSLGYPGGTSQSAYYPGHCNIIHDEVEAISHTLQELSIFPENTRISKTILAGTPSFSVLQASTEIGISSYEFLLKQDIKSVVQLVSGDHCDELRQICTSLTEALKYTANDTQKLFVSQYIESFHTGSLHAYRDSQRTWVRDKAPVIENIMGFVEPYRDPHGTRAEFEGLVAISDSEETKALKRLVDNSAKFIRRLPWLESHSLDNDGKGPFEKELFEPPDFASVHVANRMTAESSKSELCSYINGCEAETFQKHKFSAYYLWVVLHELLGHGTGKMMVQEGDDKYNFDITNKPIDPLTGKAITSWYKPGQTWTSQFGELATTVDECRAELVGAYLMDDPELLSLFGFTTDSEITNDDLTYNLYLQLGVDGLRGLQNFNIDNNKWGQAHSRAHFAMLKCLLTDGNGFISIKCDSIKKSLIVQVDRSKIPDVQSCRTYYEELSRVDGEYLEWRDIVLANKEPKWVFVQANTFLDGDQVSIREYDATEEGVIKSWAERRVTLSGNSYTLLNLLALLEPDGIDKAILVEGSKLPKWGKEFEFLSDEIDLGDAEAELLQASLINKSTGYAVLSIHRSVQVTVTRELTVGDQSKYFDAVVRIVSCGFPSTWHEDVGHRFLTWEKSEKYLPHVNRLVRYAKTNAISSLTPQLYGELLLRCISTKGNDKTSLAFASAVDLSGLIDLDMNNPSKALVPFKLALEIRENLLGPEDPLVASSFNNIGLSYTETGDLEEAYSAHENALSIRLRAETRLDNTYSNISSLLLRMGKPNEAEKMMQKCPKGRLDDAMRLASKALTSGQKLQGNKLKTCDSLYDVADIYVRQERVSSAIELLKQLVDISETLAEAEGQLARASYKLSVLYGEKEMLAESQACKARAISLRDKLRPESKDSPFEESEFMKLCLFMLW
ncbi:hypothetical protein V500_11143 [Pseudogymnoascus sp. VKM F-4518 (FW-2643)]|nr:hypothetical protein V500_11143 [Pseudogymnoascus sp. VKM F-4518 (FW-2643)]